LRSTSVFLAAGAAVLALIAPQLTLAADPHDGGPRGGGMGGQVASGPHGGVSHGGPMPPRGFHAAPPTFHGALPQGGHGGGPRYELGRPGHDLGAFNGRRFSQFTGADRDAWRGGAWRHESHNGHLGWWWVVGGLWFFYPAPIFPYPDYVGPDYYYDYYNYYPAPRAYLYYCEDPPGYYPDVQDCNVDWEPVPPPVY
jgi:hypothetical protein